MNAKNSSFIRLLSIIALLSSVVIISTSCGNEEINQLESENLEMRTREIARDSIMRNLVAAFASVDSNMKLISKHEQSINRQILVKKDTEVDNDSIMFYINQIDTLTKSNELLVDKLEDQFGTQNHNIIGLRQLISSLHDKNQFKSNELGELKGRLATINEDFRNLFEDFVYTEVEKMELNEFNAALKEKNEKLLRELNLAYIAKGTKSELKEKGLIDSKGLIFDFEMNENLDKNLFTEIDMRDITFVDLNVKKAKIISKHPANSYEIIGSKRSADKLLIKEPKEFWSVSKYLLIVIEN